MSLLFKQFKILLWRNFLIKKINFSRTIQEIIFPFYFVIIIVIVKSTFKSTSFDGIPTADVAPLQSFMSFEANPLIGFVLPTEDESIIPNIMGNKLLTGINKNLASKVFRSEKDLEDYFYNADENQKMVAGVVFEKNMEYSIRLNGTDIVDPKTLPIRDLGYTRAMIQTEAETYTHNFLQLQLSIDQALIQAKTNQTISFSPYLQKLGSPAIEYNSTEDTFNNLIGMYLTFIFVNHLCIIVSYMIYEKESKIKEGMVMAGLNRIAYWLSWFVIYAAFIAISAVLITIVLYVGKIFTSSNPVFVFLLITFYGISNCILGFLLSTFFSKSKSAIIASSFMSLLICVMYIPITFGIIDNYEALKVLFSFLFSPIAIGLSVDVILKEETRHSSVQLANFFSSKFGVYFIGLIICNLIYFGLVLLCEALIENKNRSHLFSCFKRQKQQQIDVNDPNNYENKMDIQEDDRNPEDCAVTVNHVCRVFKKPKDDHDFDQNSDKGHSLANKDSSSSTVSPKNKKTFTALSNINFQVYNNEIFAILGHNGAGKSTLLNIMVGILKASSGNVVYNGNDIRVDADFLRKNFGVCSQYNTLFDDLTVEQHVIVYSGLKGIDHPDIDGICESIDLKSHKTSKVSSLSGGQKRKLCIGLAFIGNPKYVFLDEPTTGLDPYSRHKMWDLLLSKKEGRVIFLTTHYMDEADIVADRKVILSKGKIRCLGTSLYLKSHFKMGYNLDVETSSEVEVSATITKTIEEATFVKRRDNVQATDGYQCYTWKLPLYSSPKFEALFNDLEVLSRNKNNIIKGYALSIPTLEELFIQLEDENSNGSGGNNESSGNSDKEEADTDKLVLNIKAMKLPSVPSIEKGTSAIYRMAYLVYARICIFLSNKQFALFGIFLPAFFTVLAFFISNIQSNGQNKTFDNTLLNADTLYNDTFWNFDTNQSNALFNEQIKDTLVNLLPNQNASIEFNYNLNNLDTVQMEKPYMISSIGGSIGNTNADYQLNVYYNDSMPHSLPVTFNLLSNAILASKNVNEKIVLKSHPMDYVDSTLQMVKQITIGLYLGAALASGISLYGPLVVFERIQGLVQQLKLNGLSRKNYWASVLASDSLIYYITCILVIVIGIIFGDEMFKGISLLIIIVFVIIWTMATMLYQYLVGFLFKKFDSASAYMPMMNIFPAMVCSVIIILIQQSYPNASIVLACVFTILFPVYGVLGILNSVSTMNAIKSIIPNLTFSFSDYMKIDGGISPIFLTIIFDLILYTYVLITLDRKTSQINKNDINEWNKESREKCDEVLKSGDEDVYNEWKKVQSERNTTSIRTFEISKEYEVSKPKNAKDKKSQEANPTIKLDEQEANAFGTVHKSIYKPKKFVRAAVEDISFGVNSGECFGLLGPNGAGKSTTLNMITSSLSQTTGEITYNGVDTYNADLSALSLGYCPQQDTLWKELSILKHIKLFMVMRGFTTAKAEEYARAYIECCDLIKDQNKQSCKLSGGTKRKACLLVAICGSPKHIFLDEPTAGMDPSSRRYIWNIITEVYHNREAAILMTTHSMEEAEYLCSRIAIIVNGKLVCIGSPEHLKMKYGEKYILEIQSKNISQFHAKIIEEGNLFNGLEYEMNDSSNDRRKYEVKIKNGLGQIFKTMEKAKNDNLIHDYSFGQASLEQVFINFAKTQTEVED